jgi:hypothetical protein
LKQKAEPSAYVQLCTEINKDECVSKLQASNKEQQRAFIILSGSARVVFTDRDGVDYDVFNLG